MQVEQFHRIESLFHDARKLEPAERAGFLDGACNGDLDLRAEVEALLMHAGDASERLKASPSGGFRFVAAGDQAPTVAGERLVERGPLAEGPGTRIGSYKILQKIGEGGFGCVYMAEQEEPVQRKVALKIIKLGMDTKQVIARFEAERQALALMDHPNIARVLEAGATETGRPYFVMEVVKGIPVTEYCDRSRLSIRDRLVLFMDVCHAVQHAHQKGIIHRDLKPSNVLVTLHDTRPVPKVIDFGIAKATSRRLTERTLFTEYRQLIGTPEYMSPDQAEISGLDVDTRTDIYSLGVLLYELMTGTTPFDSETLRRAACDEVQRIIREVEPPKPSTRVDTMVKEGTDVAAAHGAEPRSLSRLVRGDLDWIVMKAIEKDRTRRYQSSSEFAADIERYLRNEPVLAGPPSVVYKLAKFVRRHRLGVVAGLLITLALVTGFSLATAGLVEARREWRRSERIAEFLQGLLVSTNPEQAISEDLDVEEILVTAREVFGEDHATVAAALSSRAVLAQSAGDIEAAENLYRESLRIWRSRAGPDDLNVGTTLSRLGGLLYTTGDADAAEAALREGIDILRVRTGGESLAACEPLTILAELLANRGEFGEAGTLLREAIRIRRQLAPHQRLQNAIVTNALANVLVMTDDEDALAAIMPEATQAWREALPKDSPFLARIITQIAVWYVREDRPDDAEPLLREANDIFRAFPDSVPIERFLAGQALMSVLRDRGDHVEGIALAEEALDYTSDVEGSRFRDDVVKALANIAWDLAQDPDRAPADYRVALAAVERALVEKPDEPPYLNSLGVLQYRLGRYEEALETLARSYAHYAEEHEDGVPADLAFMAMAHHELGHADEAQSDLERLRRVMRKSEFAGVESNQRHLAEAEALFAPRGAAGER